MGSLQYWANLHQQQLDLKHFDLARSSHAAAQAAYQSCALQALLASPDVLCT